MRQVVKVWLQAGQMMEVPTGKSVVSMAWVQEGQPNVLEWGSFKIGEIVKSDYYHL